MGKDTYKQEEIFAKGDENEERGNWSNKLDFLLSAIGYAVGLGNVWRFPYVAYTNGGGSFLLPYIIMLIFAGLPLFCLEMGLGQFASLGPISMWKAIPFFKGLGVGMVVVSSLVCIYYNMIIAYTIYYLFASMNTEVPWQYCKPEWKALGCVDRVLSDEQQMERNITKQWCATMKEMYANDTDSPILSSRNYKDNCTMTEKSPSLVYWEYEVLGMSNSIAEGGMDFHWWLVLSLIGAWLVIFFALMKGVKSSGKVVYITATFPYVVLFILLIRNATLDGARGGIQFYIVPEWNQLKSYKPWFAAAIQIFYSLGVAFGGLETMSSYNKFHNNFHRDALIVAFTNCGTSIFSGFVIFSVIGHIAQRTGQAVGEVLQGSGPGLAFVAYPEGIAMMPGAPIWAILFFLMLFMLGLDTQFALMETVITSIMDELPWLRKGKRKIGFTFFLCIVMFLIGLPQCAANGVFIMELFNWYCAGFSLMILAICEIMVISYIYGLRRLRKDFQMMLGEEGLFKHMFWPYWLPNWLFITPCLLMFIFVLSCKDYSAISYANYPDAYPPWADSVGWLMVVAALIWIPVMAIVEYGKTHDWRTMRTRSPNKSFMSILKGEKAWDGVLKPTEAWGPAVERFRTGIYGTTLIPPPTYSEYIHHSGMANPSFNADLTDNEHTC